MSCNGCRVLRKGCSETCVLRSCLNWIQTPKAQGNATLFLARFFGRSDLLSLVSAVPASQRPALFESLLYEGCGRTINPVGGAVGLLSSGRWEECRAAVETVLAGGVLRPMTIDGSFNSYGAGGDFTVQNRQQVSSGNRDGETSDLLGMGFVYKMPSFCSEEWSGITSFNCGDQVKERELLNLFV